MRKSADTFMPSKVLDDIYNIISDSICIAGNEDVYFRDIIKPIVCYCDESRLISHFLWEDYRNERNDGGILFISWIENGRLFHEHFKYKDMED